MLKRKSLIFFTVVIAIVALFAATPVMAQDVLPTEVECGVYKLSLDSVVDGVFYYDIEATDPQLSKLSRAVIYQSLPDFNFNPVIDQWGQPIGVLGDGDTATKWAAGIWNGATAAFTPQPVVSGVQRFELTARSSDISLVSMILTTGKEGIITCDGLISGPGLTLVLPARESSDQTFTATEGDVTCIVNIDESGAEPIVTVTGGCLPPENNNSSYVKLLKEITLDGKPLVTFPRNVWVKSHASPGTFTYCYPSGYCVVFIFP